VNAVSEETDEALAGRAARGDGRAYGVLVARHKEGLYRLLRRYTGNSDDAYEATQDSFISAWAALRRYDTSRPFGAWLRTIAINKARDRARRNAVRRRLFWTNSLSDNDVNSTPDPTALADESVVRGQEIEAIDRAINGLPDQLKAPLLLTTFDGYSHEEAGKILGISTQAVEMKVSRARQTIKAMIGKSN
jgi:RNA polymerase sigma-70 factor (ECF subfamily)